MIKHSSLTWGQRTEQISLKGTCEHALITKAYYLENAVSAVRVSGVPRFCTDLEVMLGTPVNIYFKICWYAVSPLAVFVSTFGGKKDQFWLSLRTVRIIISITFCWFLDCIQVCMFMHCVYDNIWVNNIICW